MELVGELGDFRFGPAHLELGVVLRDLLFDLVELLDRSLDFEQVVLISLLVDSQLLLVLRQIVLGPLEIKGELARRVTVARIQVSLYLGFE
jgi:hypothetical protein